MAALPAHAIIRYLHGLQPPIIHRDLNSHNILIDRTNNAVVTDFGESRFYKSDRVHRVVHVDLTVQPGNLRWMAPEVFLQSSAYSLKADVFSYALVVWELVARQLPFPDVKAAQAAYEMANHQRPQIPKDCPEPISKLIVKCWHPTASKRPSFQELARWLKNSYPDAVAAGGHRELVEARVRVGAGSPNRDAAGRANARANAGGGNASGGPNTGNGMGTNTGTGTLPRQASDTSEDGRGTSPSNSELRHLFNREESGTLPATFADIVHEIPAHDIMGYVPDVSVAVAPH